MGITYIEGVVSGLEGRQATVRFLVDSGATYSLLPYARGGGRLILWNSWWGYSP